jgi:hypothetical protein
VGVHAKHRQLVSDRRDYPPQGHEERAIRDSNAKNIAGGGPNSIRDGRSAETPEG